MSLKLDEIVDETNYTQALKVALFHRKVTMVGYNPLNYKTRRGKKAVQPRLPVANDSKICPCCGRFPRQPLSVNFSLSEIGFLGNGHALFFTYQKLCLVLLVLFYILVGTSKFLHGLVRTYVHKQYIPTFFDETDLICLNVAILCTAVIYIFAEHMINLEIVVDEADTSPEDYSVLVTKMPIIFPQSSSKNPETELKDIFEKNFVTNMIIIDVSPCFNLTPLSVLKTAKRQLIEQYKQYYLERNKKRMVSEILFNSNELPFEMHEFYGVIPTSYAKQKLKLKEIEDSFRDQISVLRQKIDTGYSTNDILFLGEAIISFETQQMKQFILENDQIEVFMYGHKLEFKKADHPKGVYWYNLHLSSEDYKIRNVFSIIVCAAIVFASLAIQLTLNYIKLVVANEHHIWAQVLTYSSLLMVNIINLTIPVIMLKVLPNFEGHRTHNDGIQSFVKKSILLQLVNTLLVPVIVRNLITHDKEMTFIAKQAGILFRNAVFSLIGHAIPKKTIKKQLEIGAYQKGFSMKRFLHLKSLVTVSEFCDMYEYPEFEIDYRSSEIIKTILLTFVFGFQNSWIILYSIVAMLCNYWIDKYNLSRRRTVSFGLDSTLNTFMMRIIHLTVAMFLCSIICLHGFSYIRVLLFTVSLILYICPAILIARLRTRRSKNEIGRHLKYPDCKKTIFQTDYRRENPALKGHEKRQYQGDQVDIECKKDK